MSPEALRNIRRHGYGGPAHLLRQAEYFVLWKNGSELIDAQYEGMASLPDVQVVKGRGGFGHGNPPEDSDLTLSSIFCLLSSIFYPRHAHRHCSPRAHASALHQPELS